jgi:hypothetical protein
MASPNQTLTRGWIQYLKNNQIAGLVSNPKTGRIDYNRTPKVADLVSYLSKDFDENIILRAIKQVIGARQNPQDSELATQGDRDPSTWSNSEVTPDTPSPTIGNDSSQVTQPVSKKYNNNDAEDATYSQRGVSVPGKASSNTSPQQDQTIDNVQRPKRFNTNGAQDAEVKDAPANVTSTNPLQLSAPNNTQDEPKRKPRFKYRTKGSTLKEALYDWQGVELDEKEIQQIFKILSNNDAGASINKANVGMVGREIPPQPSMAGGEDREAQIKKLKDVIRNTMTQQQRTALWRALTDVQD